MSNRTSKRSHQNDVLKGEKENRMQRIKPLMMATIW